MAPKTKKLTKEEEKAEQWKKINEEAQKKDNDYLGGLKSDYDKAKDLSEDPTYNSNLEQMRGKNSVGTNLGKAWDEKYKSSLKSFYEKYLSQDSAFKKKVEELGEQFVKKDEGGKIIYDDFGKQVYSDDNIFSIMCNTITNYEGTIANNNRRFQMGAATFDATATAEAFDQMIDIMNKGMLLQGSDEKFFMDYYCDLMDISAQMHELEDGKLFVPAPGEKTLDGKKIHRVTNVTYETDNGVTKAKAAWQPGTDVKKDTSLQANQNIQLGQIYSNEITGSIFQHTPCMEDIEQGVIGDCYLVAALGSIASKDPDKIREMIADNYDGTATVRFFNKQLEPVYVTVDKTFPFEDRREFLFNGGNNWCGIISKAYVVSGLHCDKLKEAEQGTYHGNYGDIEGGNITSTLTTLLGVSVTPEAHHQERIDLIELSQKSNNEKDVDALFEKITQGAKLDSVMLCSTPDFDKYNPNNVNTAGTPKNHAYSLVGTEIDTTTNKRYVRVRNPHADTIRSYDDQGNPIEMQFGTAKAHPGEALIEIHDFAKVFDDVTITSYDLTIKNQLQAKDVFSYKDLYQDAVEKICNGLQKEDNWLLRATKKNSPQFTEFKKAAMEARTKFKDSKDLDSIQKSMSALFEKAQSYREYCEGSVKKQKGLGLRASSRYLAADITGELEKVVKENNGKEPWQRERADVKNIVNGFFSKEQTGMRKLCCDVKKKDHQAQQMKEQKAEQMKAKKAQEFRTKREEKASKKSNTMQLH